MKKSFSMLMIASCIGASMLTSCGTLFTSSSQSITFSGNSNATIYDQGRVVARTGDDGLGTAKIRKSLSDKTFIAKKEGYKPTSIELETTLHPVSILNLTNIFGWGIDLATGKCCRWDSEFIEFEMEKQ